MRQVAGQLGIRPSVDEAHPDHVHRAVLAGLLSQLGQRDGDGREYVGARNARFVIAPGSVLTRKSPRWVMAGELVETNQIWARRVAQIRPEWAEPLAQHLVKRSYGEAVWDADQGRAVTSENVTLYGLAIVSNRMIAVDRVDPELAREMFIRHALVAGDVPSSWSERHDFVAANDRFVARVRLLEARVRRIDLLDDRSLFEFFDERIPDDVTSTRHFDRWWKDARADDPSRLELRPSVLAGRSGIDLADYPDTWRDGTADFRLTYRFEPDSVLDGATVNIPVTALNHLDGDGLDWLIPGYRRELVGMLLRSLPKETRRHLIPMNETADAAFAALGSPDGRLVDRLATVLGEIGGHPVASDEFDAARLPSHLRLHLVVVDDDGEVLDAGDDLAAIRERQAGATRSAIAAAAPIEERRDIVRWDLGTLDRVVERRAGDGHVVRAYPTLLDRGDRVSLRVVDNPALQERAMRGGVRRLLLMAAAPTPAKVRRSLDSSAALALAAADIDLDDLVDDSIQAAIDAVMARSDLPWDESAFAALESAVRHEALPLASDVLATAADIVTAADRVHRRLGSLNATGWRPTVADAGAHVERLVSPGFVRRTGTDRLPDVHRYVRGIEYRLDHLGGDVVRDQRRMDEVRPVEREYAELVDRGDLPADGLREVAWMVEELRMSVFAQPEGVKGPISAKRIRRALGDVVRGV